jgi:catechol 2,3-dioxygenase-like lactoylglutathione lyase family enzyme
MRTVFEKMNADKIAVRQIVVGGGARLSFHQKGNGLPFVAVKPTVGSADLCFRWCGTIDAAVSLLKTNDIDIIEGPVDRQNANGLPSISVYFRDLDGNLLELMANEKS